MELVMKCGLGNVYYRPNLRKYMVGASLYASYVEAVAALEAA
jgi:hypothetical protein